MYTDLSTLCVSRAATLEHAATCMGRSRLGIVLIVDDKARLVGTVTDGDLRRAILNRVDLKAPVTTVLDAKAGSPHARPVTASAGSDRATYLRLFKEHNVAHLPLLDDERRVVGLLEIVEFVPDPGLPVQAVIMAGGAGARLQPMTADTPKPMLPLGDRPLMEIIIDQLRDAGINRVHVTTHHKAEKIHEHFGDGRGFGVDISYVAEERPLGTAGGLGLIERSSQTTLVVNGDILTQVDFRAMLAFHRDHGADLTMAVRQLEVAIPYGVVESVGASVKRLDEKPSVSVVVNAGIYLLEPRVYDFIPPNVRMDMTELIQRVIAEGRPVASFPISEYWLDIGQHADYQRAQQDIRGW